MARTARVRSQHARITDRIHLGAAAKFFPLDQVQQILMETGRRSRRQRQLPAQVMVYYVIAMALWLEVSCQEVLRCLVEGLAPLGIEVRRLRCTGRSAISMARARLGAEPLRRLLERCVRPIATAKTPGAYYRGWRLVSLDGSTLDVADTPANAAAFGRPGASRGHSAFPQLRLVSLVESGTHVLFATVWGALRQAESTLAKTVLEQLAAGMLCFADRGFFGFALWEAACRTGADLVWRGKKNLVLACRRRLSDGSYLSRVYPSPRDRRHDRGGRFVRVIEYRLGSSATRYRLITTILDEQQAPAHELAALYHERWEIENAFDELKTHLRGRQIVLRSKTPELVEQELYGLLLAHFAIRGLMHEAAQQADLDPDALSFVHSFRVVRRKLPAFVALPPSGAPEAASGRPRGNPRGASLLQPGSSQPPSGQTQDERLPHA